MKILALAIFILSFSPRAFSADDTPGSLPPESGKLIDDLQKWEIAERARIEREISKKRNEVIEGLERHLESYTKRADLDRALTIRKAIDSLKVQDQRPPAGLSFEMPWDEGEGAGKVRVDFLPGGVATFSNLKIDKVFDQEFRWSLTGDTVVEFWFHTREEGDGMRWTFSKDFSVARVRLKRGDQRQVVATRLEK